MSMWFVIWAVLIVAALAFFAVLGLRLWRNSARPLLNELGEATKMAQTLSEQVEALRAANPPLHPQPSIVATDEQRQAYRQVRLDNKSAKSTRKWARRERAYTRWVNLGRQV